MTRGGRTPFNMCAWEYTVGDRHQFSDTFKFICPKNNFFFLRLSLFKFFLVFLSTPWAINLYPAFLYTLCFAQKKKNKIILFLTKQNNKQKLFKTIIYLQEESSFFFHHLISNCSILKH